MTKKQKFWIFILYFIMKPDGVYKIFSFAKQDISAWVSKHEPKE